MFRKGSLVRPVPGSGVSVASQGSEGPDTRRVWYYTDPVLTVRRGGAVSGPVSTLGFTTESLRVRPPVVP